MIHVGITLLVLSILLMARALRLDAKLRAAVPQTRINRERRRLSARASFDFNAHIALLLPDHWRPEVHSAANATVFRLLYHTLGAAILCCVVAIAALELA